MFKSPLLGSFSGKTDPQQVVATSGSVSFPFELNRFVVQSFNMCILFIFQMLVLLYSDTNYVLNGFRAEYFISNWYVYSEFAKYKSL